MTEILQLANSNILNQEYDGEVVIVSLENGCYYSVTGCGQNIWHAIRNGVVEADLIAALTDRFPAAATLPEETAAFIADLLAEQLVVRAPGPVAGADLGECGEPYEPPTLAKFDDMQDLFLLDPIHDVDETGWPAVPNAETD